MSLQLVNSVVNYQPFKKVYQTKSKVKKPTLKSKIHIKGNLLHIKMFISMNVEFQEQLFFNEVGCFQVFYFLELCPIFVGQFLTYKEKCSLRYFHDKIKLTLYPRDENSTKIAPNLHSTSSCNCTQKWNFVTKMVFTIIYSCFQKVRKEILTSYLLKY